MGVCGFMGDIIIFLAPVLLLPQFAEKSKGIPNKDNGLSLNVEKHPENFVNDR